MKKRKNPTALSLRRQYLQHKALFKNLICILLSLLTVFSLAFTPAPLTVDGVTSSQRMLSADASILLLILGISLFFFINMQFQKA